MQPYFQKDGIAIFHGDCRLVMADLQLFNTVLLTDPPYGLAAVDSHDAYSLKKHDYQTDAWQDNAAYVLSVCVPTIKQALTLCARGAVTPGKAMMFDYPRPRDIGCFYTPSSPSRGSWGFHVFNPILYYGDSPFAGKGQQSAGRTITEASRVKGHPCPKPLKAWTWLAAKVALPGDTIFDPFLGSGTSLLAARDIGCSAIGIEIEECYCETAAKRMEQQVFNFQE